MITIAGKKTIMDGHKFDSKLEADHYKYLKAESETVEIIELQPQYELFPRFSYHNIETDKVATYSRMIYTPDFLIKVKGIDKPIALEVKGFRRAEYMMRRKLFIMKYVADGELYFLESNRISDMRKFIERYKGEQS